MNKWLSLGAAIITIAVGIIGWFVLPDVVAVQIGFDGNASNTLPKLAAILVPVALSVAAFIMNLKSDEKSKGTVFLIIGLVVIVFITLFQQIIMKKYIYGMGEIINEKNICNIKNNPNCHSCYYSVVGRCSSHSYWN